MCDTLPLMTQLITAVGEQEKPMMRRLVLCRKKEIETISEVYFQPEAIKSVKKKKKLLREEMHVQYVQLIRLAG